MRKKKKKKKKEEEEEFALLYFWKKEVRRPFPNVAARGRLPTRQYCKTSTPFRCLPDSNAIRTLSPTAITAFISRSLKKKKIRRVEVV